jgi:hypothetical protein
MKINNIYGAGLGFFLFAFSASASSVPFDTVNYNFQLPGGGGGATAKLNSVTVETFCDNFANDIGVPDNYAADVTTLSTTANLDETRFGEVAAGAWTTISLSGTGSIVTTDDAILNGANGLARYEMVAYLVSQYNVTAGATAANDEIQEAIWTLMDPKAEGPALNPDSINPTTDLEAAASWYATMNEPANISSLNAFLANYEIVSDPTMIFSNGLGYGGFQEQIVDPVHVASTPEPSGSIWMLAGLFGVAGFLVQRARARKLAPAAA